jgi:hypothetical protein
MMFWCNFLGYQLVWFIAVIGASRGDAWPSVSGAAIFIAWQVLVAARPTVELRLMVVAICFGAVIDGALATSGWVQYSTPAPALPLSAAPIWILAIWASFAMTLNRTLAYLRGRPALASVFGAIGGPLAYYGAANTWPAIVFEPPLWRSLLWLAGGWAVAMPTLVVLARRWMGVAGLASAPTRAEAP